MTTFAELKSRIASDMARTDLLSEIGRAINDAIREYARHPFHWHRQRSLTFNTVAGTEFYGATVDARIARIVSFDLVVGGDGNLRWPLERTDGEDIEIAQAGTTARNRPSLFQYVENEIRLWPVPDKPYSIRVVGLVKPVDLNADSDSNLFLAFAEPLIRASSVRRVRSEILSDYTGAAAMAEVEAQALKNLKTEDALREGWGKIIPTQF